jgi:chromosome segregation ATPase
MARLQDVLATVDGRTQRHEAGQDLAREVKQELATLQEQLEAESSVRRDLQARLERRSTREQEDEERLHRALETVVQRLDRFEGRQAAGDDRQRHIELDLAERDQDEQSVEGRLGALERRIDADREVARHMGEEVGRLSAVLPGLATGVDDLRGRLLSLLADQRRVDDDIAALRAIRDREDDLLEVLEQQRATRARMEERLNGAEEQIEEMRRASADSGEERALIARTQAGTQVQLRALSEELEALRLLFIAHFRRQVQADEQAARRHVEELEREARTARELLVRLTEQSEELRGGQPL